MGDLDELRSLIERWDSKTTTDSERALLVRLLIERWEAGIATDSERALLKQLIPNPSSLASGRRAIVVHGDASESIFNTGDNNDITIVKHTDSADLFNTYQQLLVDNRQRQHSVALNPYLTALQARCDQLPYITLPGKPLPALTTIYIEQRSEEQNPPEQSSEAASPPVPPAERRVERIEDALARHQHILLEGGPGLGKSTLHYHLALTLARTVLSEQQAELVPILVSARELAARRKDLSTNLREQVTAELMHRLPAPLPDDFFTTPPFPGATWLILLDGLDEIVDQQMRDHLVAAITDHAVSPRSSYRFLVTTRPIPDIQRSRWKGFGHYILRPFEPRQVERFAQNWFSVRAGARPDDVERFLQRVQTSRIVDLSQVPLLLTMAAIIYESDRDKPFPTRRADLYERFITILLEDEEAKRGTLESYIQEWRSRYGTDGEMYADKVFMGRREILERLAFAEQHGRRQSPLEEVIRYVYEQGWIQKKLDRPWLREHMAILLQRTGLWHEREERFIHDTFREYLAASALAVLHTPDDEDTWLLITRWVEEGWREVILFLLGIWNGEERKQDITRLMRRIREHGQPGLIFASAVLAEGVRVGDGLEAEIIDALLSKAQQMKTYEVFRPANALDALRALSGYEQVRSGLAALANNPKVDISVLQWAARFLEQNGRFEEAAQLWVAVLKGSRANRQDSREAIAALERLGQNSRLVQILPMIASDAQAAASIRNHAATRLVRLGHSKEAVQAWLAISRDPRLGKKIRADAAIALAQFGKFDDLSRLICDPTVDASIRAKGFAILEHAEPSDAAGKVWLALGLNSIVNLETRLQAATTLERFGQVETAVQVWQALSQSISLDAQMYIQITQALERLGHPVEAAQVWETLATLPTTPKQTLNAATALEHLGRPADAARNCMILAQDPTVAGLVRREAIAILQRLNRVDDLLTLARTPRTRTAGQIDALIALEQLSHTTEATHALEALAEQPGLDSQVYLQVATALARIGRLSAAIQACLNAAQVPEIDTLIRRQITATLQRLGYTDKVPALADNSTTNMQAAAAIAVERQLQHKLDLRVCIALAQDPTSSAVTRKEAITTLQRLDRIDDLLFLVRTMNTLTVLEHLSSTTETAHIWEVLAGEPGLHPEANRRIALTLENLSRPEMAVRVWVKIARAPTADAFLWGQAIAALQRLGSAESLLALAQDSSVRMQVRLAAIGSLETLDPTGAAETWKNLLQEPNVDLSMRQLAAAALERLGHHEQAVRVWFELVRNAGTALEIRQRAAKQLYVAGQIDSLLALADDTRLAAWVRQEIAEALGNLGLVSEGTALLLGLAQNRTESRWIRREAASALERLGQVQAAIEAWLALLRDTRLDTSIHKDAIEALKRLDWTEQTDAVTTVLSEFARDARANPQVRETAERVLRSHTNWKP